MLTILSRPNKVGLKMPVRPSVRMYVHTSDGRPQKVFWFQWNLVCR